MKTNAPNCLKVAIGCLSFVAGKFSSLLDLYGNIQGNVQVSLGDVINAVIVLLCFGIGITCAIVAVFDKGEAKRMLEEIRSRKTTT